MSMVMPRRFSSSRRSASMPVRAFTKAVLPWSICPAVPTMIFFIVPAFILLLAGAALAQQTDADHPLFRTGVALVKADVQVVDRGGRAVPGLAAADFRIYDDGHPQKIAYFGR